MKNITIQVPREGTSVQLVLRAGSSLGQVVIVASDEVEVRLAELAPSPPTGGKVPARDLDSIFQRLAKLRPTKRAAAVNSIKAMFQFTEPISDEEAGKILDALCQRGSFSIDASDRLQFHRIA